MLVWREMAKRVLRLIAFLPFSISIAVFSAAPVILWAIVEKE